MLEALYECTNERPRLALRPCRRPPRAFPSATTYSSSDEITTFDLRHDRPIRETGDPHIGLNQGEHRLREMHISVALEPHARWPKHFATQQRVLRTFCVDEEILSDDIGGLHHVTTQIASFIPARRAIKINIAQTLAGE